MFARRAVSTVARRAVTARPVVPARSFASSMKRFESSHSDPKPGEHSKQMKPFEGRDNTWRIDDLEHRDEPRDNVPPADTTPTAEITNEHDLLPSTGAAPGTMPTDIEQATGLERLEILGKMQGVDIFDLSPLDASRKGTMEDPIIVKSFGDEQYQGCTGYPADSHVVIWLTTSRDRPIERCPECGSVYKMEYVGPQESHDTHGHSHGEHDIHHDSDGQHNYEGEPVTMADFIKPEYR